MKKLLVTMFAALLMAGCVGQAQKQVQEEAIDLDDPATLDTIIAGAADGEQVFEGDLSSKKPFTHSGWVKNMYDNGQIGSLFQLKDGKMDGLQTLWYRNGQKKLEIVRKDGKLITVVVWKPNGEKCPVTNVVDGNGVTVAYNDDGTEKRRDTYKDGKPVFD